MGIRDSISCIVSLSTVIDFRLPLVCPMPQEMKEEELESQTQGNAQLY